MSDQPPSIDEMLNQSRVLTDAYDDYDSQAAVERIARRTLWLKAAALEDRARRARHCAALCSPASGDAGLPRTRWLPPAGHEVASRRLEALSFRIVRDRGAIRAMARLVDDARIIDPAGALAFACLLYLADCDGAAQFWWQFAAGSGSAAAAGCLYLYHLQHGESRTAEYWQDQARLLQRLYGPRLEDQTAVRVHEAQGDHTYPPGTPEAGVAALLTSPASGGSGEQGGRWWVFTSSLAEAVRRLHTCTDEEYGDIPQPDPELAAEVAEAAAP